MYVCMHGRMHQVNTSESSLSDRGSHPTNELYVFSLNVPDDKDLHFGQEMKSHLIDSVPEGQAEEALQNTGCTNM